MCATRIFLWVLVTVGETCSSSLTPLVFPISLSNANDVFPPGLMRSPSAALSERSQASLPETGKMGQQASADAGGEAAAQATLPPGGAGGATDVRRQRYGHTHLLLASHGPAAAPSSRPAPSRPRRDTGRPRPDPGWLRPVPRYMWEMYHRFLASRVSCRSFISLPNLGGATEGCGNGEVLFDPSRGEEAGGDLVSAHLHIELHLRASGAAHAAHADDRSTHTKQGRLRYNASALLEVTVTHLDNTSTPLTEVVRIGEDAVFELTREVLAWTDDGASRLGVSVRPLDINKRHFSASSSLLLATSTSPLATSSLPLATRHHSDDHKEAQVVTHCNALMWEASLMITREDQDACTSSRVFSPLEAEEEETPPEGKSIPEEWYTPQRRRSRREAKDPQGGRKREGKNRRRNGCRLRRLYVNFRDIGWNSWIIAPTGYEAGACRGSCRFPLQALHSPTNYAMITVLRRELHGRGGGACCVPYELEPLSLLYYDYASNVVLKKHPEMVVRRCGCR